MLVLTLAYLAGIAVAFPPAGPLTLLFYRHAMLREFRSAGALAVVIALMDGLYAAMSAYGYVWLLEAPGTVVLVARMLGVALIGALGIRYAFFPPPIARHLGGGPRRERMGPVLFQGVGIALFNPSALLTWIVVVDVLRTTFGIVTDLTVFEKLTLPLAVSAGTATWFLGVLTAWRSWVRPPSPSVALGVVRVVGLVLLGTALVYGWKAANQDPDAPLRHELEGAAREVRAPASTGDRDPWYGARSEEPMSSRPPFVVHRAAVHEQEGAYPAPFDEEKLSFGRDLGRAAGSRHLGAWHERLPPGRRTSFTHAHLLEEELIYVLSGRPSLRWIAPEEEPREVVLEAGDLVAFPAATGIAHTFVNRGAGDATLLVVGERRQGERAHYPEDEAYDVWRTAEAAHRSWTDHAGPQGDARPPAYRIETPRLVLRPWEPLDAGALASMVGDNLEHLRPWMPWAREVPSLDEELGLIRTFRAAFDSDRDYVYGAFLPDGRAIGGTGLHPRVGPAAVEIGYWIDRAHEGQGYVTEWCAALVRVAFEGLGLDRVEIRCDPRNERSAAVASRLGARHVATLERRHTAADGIPRGVMVFDLFPEDVPPSVSEVPVRAFDAVGRRLV